MNSHSTVVNREALTENYVPEGIVGRERERQQLRRCLHPATERRKPLHVWIHGGSGTGKTVLARSVLSELEQRHHIETAYVCCWRHHSLYKVVDALVTQLRILRAEQQDTALKLEKLEKHLEHEPFLIVLDEIDLTAPKERDAIVRGLCNLGQVGLICISRKMDTFFSLEPGTRSRLSPQFIECKRYNHEELLSVLTERCELALAPDTCPKSVLERIARLSRGHARTAIQTLRSAVEWAEQGAASEVTHSDVAHIWNDIDREPKQCILASLTPDHRTLYDLVRTRRRIASAHLRKLYLKQCERLRREPVAIRTFSKYMSRLMQCGLVACERALPNSQGRLFKPAE